MLIKKLAVFALILVACNWCTAQSVPLNCSEADRKAANDLAREFFAEMRKSLNLASLRPRYLSSSCEPVFGQLFEIDSSLRAGLDCGLVKEYGDAALEFVVLLSECGLRSDSWPAEDPLAILPPEIVQKVLSHPMLRQTLDDKRAEKIRIESREQLGEFVTALQQINGIARHYIESHPETAQRAASRLAVVAHDLYGGTTRSECGSSDDDTYFDLPKGIPLVVTAESVFVLAITREDGHLRIAKIVLAEN